MCLGRLLQSLTFSLYHLVSSIHVSPVQIRKTIFKIGRSDGKEDLVCPLDNNTENRYRHRQNGSSVIANQNAELMLEEKDEVSIVVNVAWY